MSIISPQNTSIMNERIAYDLMQNKSKKKTNILYYQISHTTQLIAKDLFLNYYEVNKIVAVYLDMWSKHPENSFVDKNKIAELFIPQNRGFVNYFFTSDQVSCNDFVLFICFFLFYDSCDILSVLLAMCGVNSNILISKEKLKQFFSIFNLVETDYADLFMLLNQSASISDHDTYSVKLFMNYFKNNFHFSVVLFTLKQDISKLTLDAEDISTIENRRFHYNKLIQESMNISELPIESSQAFFFLPKPSEPCFSKLYRILFTSKPNPYHYDFFVYISPDKLKAALLCQIKQRYGYSTRGNSYQSVFMSPRLCLRISSRENSKMNKTLSKLSGKCLSSPSLEKLSLYSKKNLPTPQ